MGGRAIKVAVSQIFCIDGDKEGNFVRIEHALGRTGRVDLACFPETCLLGWVNPEAHRLADPIPGDTTDRLCELARRYDLMLCVGLAEKEGERLYDSAVLIGPDGRILLKHRKINILSHLMTPPYTPGDRIEAVDTDLGRIGLLICADTFKEEILAEMRGKRPDLLLVPYGWAAPKEKWPQHGESLRRTVSRAALSVSVPVIGTDLVGMITHGPWTGYTYGGQSVVADSNGEILAVGADRDSDVVVLEVELK
ncbi:TPA: carbon-nitrogen hydrolase family protein [Candidatus Poribacteria bacterium]|nr:carbon-nitrogen hydrolase family protein [Candidatus Poribacteria bacterium]